MSLRNPDSGTSGSSSPPPSSPTTQEIETYQTVSKQSQSPSFSASNQEHKPQQQNPNGENPIDETPDQENTIEETPNQEKPTEKAPFDEIPNQEKPIEKAPFDETPNQENPIEKSPFDKYPNQENPTEETETPERESKRMKTGGAVLEQGQYDVDALEEESSDDESSDTESSDEEYDPNIELILFPEISKGSEEYDDITLMKYIIAFEEGNTCHVPLPISIKERPPKSYHMKDLLSYIKEIWKHENLSTSLLRNKIIQMQNKYRNILQEIGPYPRILDFDTKYGRLHFEFLQQTLK